MKVLNRFRRWRRTKGYGIHSPYAFRFVREVIRSSNDYGYYAYAEIENELRRHHPSLKRSTARLIFRLLVELNPATVSIASDRAVPLLHFLVEKACPRAEILEQGGDFHICIGMTKSAHAPRHALFTNRKNPAATAAATALRHGHIYKSNSSLIIASHSHLPLQTFEVRF